MTHANQKKKKKKLYGLTADNGRRCFASTPCIYLLPVSCYPPATQTPS